MQIKTLETYDEDLKLITDFARATGWSKDYVEIMFECFLYSLSSPDTNGNIRSALSVLEEVIHENNPGGPQRERDLLDRQNQRQADTFGDNLQYKPAKDDCN